MKRVLVVGLLLLFAGAVGYLLLEPDRGRIARRGAALDSETGRGAGRHGAAEDQAESASPGRAAAGARNDDDPNRVPGPDVVLRGRVLYGDRGVAKAAVAVYPARPDGTGASLGWLDASRTAAPPEPVAETEADDDGRFMVTVARRTRLTIRAGSPGLGFRHLLLLVPAEGDPDQVLIRLRDGFRLRGLVVDEEEEAVEGATVQAVTTNWRVPTFRFDARTDEGGRFEFAGLEEASYRVVVAVEGYPELAKHVQVPATAEMLLRLVPGGSIRGKVRFAGGDPVAGAKLQLTTGDTFRGLNGVVEALTDPSGEYLIERALPGPVTRAYLFQPSRSSDRGELLLPRGLVKAGEELRYDIELEAGVAVSGIVVERGTGEPVAGAGIELFQLSTQNRSMQGVDRAVSGAGGRFVFEHVGEGTYALEAKAPFAIRRVNRWMQGEQGLTMDLVVGGDVAPPEQKLEVEACGAVRGRVLDADRLDLRFLNLNMQTEQGWAGGTVDDFGSFEILHVPPGEDLVVNGWNPQMKSEPFDVDEGKVTEIEIDPTGQGGFGGTVVDEAGEPVAGVIVKAVPEQTFQKEIRSVLQQQGRGGVHTDAQGRFLVQVQEWQRKNYSKWFLAAVHRDYPIVISESLKLPPEGETSETTLVLAAGGVVTGRVEFDGGGPAAGVYIGANPKPVGKSDARQSRSGYSDLSGRFEIGGLGDGPYTVSGWHQDWTAEAVEAEAGEGEIRLVLRRQLSIMGVVVDDKGRPVTQARIAAIIPQGKKEQKRWGSISAGGRFRIAGLDAGTYVLEVSPQQNSWQAAGTFETTRTLPIATGSENVEIVVSSGATLEGRVLGPGNRPVGGAGIVAVPLKLEGKEAQNPWQVVRPRAVTNGRGEFSLEGLSDGEVELLVFAVGYQPASQRTSLAADVLVSLRRGETIEGRMVRPDGSPLANQYFSLRPADTELQQKLNDWQRRGAQSWNVIGGWQMLRARTDSKGEFRLLSLMPGDYILNLQAGEAVAPATTLSTGSGPVTIALERALSVRGRVTDSRGQPIVLEGNNQVWLSAKVGESWRGGTRPDSDGYFEIRGLPAGRVTIQAWAGNQYKGTSVEAVAGDRNIRLVLEAQ